MEEIVKLIVDNGIGVLCVAYLIYFQSTTMKGMSNTMKDVSINLSLINQRLEDIESKVK